jgi:cytoskeletal protein CcmA (bactofilin family)
MAHIGKSISIHGDLTGDEDLVLEGTVEGKVSLPNNELTIGANGLIPADVNAKSVIVIGHVRGNVNGTERVEIQASGVVEGDVRTPRLIVAEGAVLNGSILMADETPAKTVAVPAEPVADPAAKRGTSEARRSARSSYATGAG